MLTGREGGVPGVGYRALAMQDKGAEGTAVAALTGILSGHKEAQFVSFLHKLLLQARAVHSEKPCGPHCRPGN